MKAIHPPNKAQSHEHFGDYRRVRVGIFAKSPAVLAVKAVSGGKMRFGPDWVNVARGENDEMRELAARLAAVIDRYASACGLEVECEVEA